MPPRRLAIACLCLLFASVAVRARGESYNEEIFGDLSNEPSAPAPLPLTHGDVFNTLTGYVGGGDIDVIHLIVPEFHKLRKITLASYNGASQSFAGLQRGSIWTAGTGGAVNPASLLGWTHFGPAAGAGAAVGQDILDNMAVPRNGSSGFTPPLGPGSYTLLLQDTGAEVRYSLVFDTLLDLKAAGDFNNDFLINSADLAKWRSDMGLNNGSDADGDGDSDGNDFLIWQRNVGRTDFGLTLIPEPASAAVALSAAWLLLAACRSRRCRQARSKPQ